MKRSFLCGVILSMLSSAACQAQEASFGFDARATVTAQFAGSSLLTESPRFGDPVTVGYRTIVYPILKLNDNWAVTGALQSYSQPFFQESFTTSGYGVRDNILQGTLNYSRISDKGSVLVRVGEVSSAFGSFLLHYDDADNALIDLPLQYGYYYKPVSTLSLSGGQIDAARGKWDGRIQFVNSSAANPRSLFDHDQYANWAGGGGFTIRQGLRVGASAYRGPYLDRQGKFFQAGEAPPVSLPAHALGFDAQWARGHWNTQAEWQMFVDPYKVVPTFRQQAGYAETRRVLNARWFVAARVGYLHASYSGYQESYEGVAAFRPNRLQLIKVSYELRHQDQPTQPFDNTVTVQLVTSLHLFSFAGK